MNGKGLIIVSTLATLIISMQGWLIAEQRALRQDIRGIDARLNHVERDVAVLLERTTPLAPVAAKPFRK